MTIKMQVIIVLLSLAQTPVSDLFRPIQVSDLTENEARLLARKKTLPTTVAWVVVEYNEKATQSKTLGILLPNNKRFEITEFVDVFGRLTWKKGPDSVLLSVTKGATSGVMVTGLIYYANNVYSVSPLGDGRAVIILLDQTKFPKD